jgi:hypothetical protein
MIRAMLILGAIIGLGWEHLNPLVGGAAIAVAVAVIYLEVRAP